MIWKCEVPIWTHRCLACLYDIKAVFIIILKFSYFKIQVISIYSILLTQTTKTFQKLASYREGWGQLLVVHGAEVQNVCQSKPIQSCEAHSHNSDVMYSMLLKSHYVPLQELISAPNLYTGTRVKGYQRIRYKNNIHIKHNNPHSKKHQHQLNLLCLI